MVALDPAELEDTALSYERVRARIEAIDDKHLSPMNVDPVVATSIVLGSLPRILDLRPRLAALPEFDIGEIDRLGDYARATWYLHVINSPEPTPVIATEMEEEAKALREKLLRWAGPIAAEGKFNPEALRMIRAGSGHRDMPSDLASLVALFRQSWDTVKGICGVTEADLVRGGQLSMAVFTAVAQRQARASNARSESTLRVRRAWTCLDRAYDECRRGVAFLLRRQGDAAEVTPNLRDKRGPRAVAARGNRPPRAKKRAAVVPVTAAGPPPTPPPAADSVPAHAPSHEQ